MAAGIDLLSLSKLISPKQNAFTLDGCSHLPEEAAQGAADRMTALFAGT